ncbi:MAG: hypothetical protein AAF558_13805 [Verrucomicrobiota bacterium]
MIQVLFVILLFLGIGCASPPTKTHKTTEVEPERQEIQFRNPSSPLKGAFEFFDIHTKSGQTAEKTSSKRN